VGLLMISNIKYYSFKTLDRKRVPFAVLPIAVFIFAAITYNIPVGILVISIIYALSGFVTTFMARKNNPI
jgi:CDP-diacylglycerol--serine O-phosphatidyltransferase